MTSEMPDVVYVAASETTGKMYAHLYTGKNRTKYTRADHAEELARCLDAYIRWWNTEEGTLCDIETRAREALSRYRKDKP